LHNRGLSEDLSGQRHLHAPTLSQAPASVLWHLRLHVLPAPGEVALCGVVGAEGGAAALGSRGAAADVALQSAAQLVEHDDCAAQVVQPVPHVVLHELDCAEIQ
jgi:hypothetical protein